MVYTLGEVLLDIIFNDKEEVTATSGGAMLNVAVSLARSGITVSLISELGDDPVGEKIKNFLSQNRVDTNYINLYKEEKSSLALAFLDQAAKPTYSFYKRYPAHRSLKTVINFSKSDYILFGSLYSIDKAIRKDIIEIIEKAKGQDAIIIYDPNIRHAHHLSDTSIRNAVYKNIKLADIIKGSDEDFTNIFGEGNPDYWAAEVRKYNHDSIVIVTLGEKGSLVFFGKQKLVKPSKPVKVVSTIGAGDAFSAGMLFKLVGIKKKAADISINEWSEIIDTATLFAAEVCGRKENYIK